MFKSVVWASTIDYPDQVATVLFVGNCNWSCEYCHNVNIKNNKSIDFKSEILPRLLDRKDFIDHVVISGGECTCYTSLTEVIDILINNEFTVGIHTNGTNPKMLRKIIDNISFIGMDIKCSNYKKYFNLNEQELDNIKESIDVILNSDIEYEFRTTLFPKFFENKYDVFDIAKKLKKYGVEKYVLQEYVNDFNTSLINPWSKNYILEITKECNKIIKTELKGYIE